MTYRFAQLGRIDSERIKRLEDDLKTASDAQKRFIEAEIDIERKKIEHDRVIIDFKRKLDSLITNFNNLINATIGLFQADVQCEWTGPPPGDPFPDHVQVLTTPLVADLPFDSGVAKEIVIVTYNGLDGGSPAAGGTDPARFGVIRILNGQTCEQIVNLDDPENRVIAASPPAIGDINGDGFPDIVTHRALGGVIAYAWNEPAETYTGLWVALETDISGERWDGLALHDLDDDGIPEVISASEVYDGPTGSRLNSGQVLSAAGAMSVPAVADVDGDGEVEITARDIHRWNADTNQWDLAYPLAHSAQFWAVADFGTPGATPAEFDANSFDGIAEIVSTGNGNARLMTLSGQVLLNVSSGILGAAGRLRSAISTTTDARSLRPRAGTSTASSTSIARPIQRA